MSLHTGLDQIREPEMPFFSIGGIIGRSLWIVVWNFVSFIAMTIVLAMPLLVYVAVLASLRFGWSFSADVTVVYRTFFESGLVYSQFFETGLLYLQFKEPTTEGTLLSAILWLLLFIAVVGPAAAMAQRAFQSMLGRKASFGNCVILAFAALPRIIVFAFLMAVAYGAVAAVLGYIYDAAVGPTLPIVPTFILILLGIGAVMFLSTIWWLGVPILMVEWVNPFLALRRSWKLTRGKRWHVAAILVLLGLSIALLQLVLARLLPADTTTDSAQVVSAGLFGLSALFGIFFYFLSAVAAAIGYFHLVGEKEGILAFDRPFV